MKILNKQVQTKGSYILDSISTKEARKVYGWNRQVLNCYQRTRAFTRLKINKHSIIYGKVAPEHFVEDLVARWFLSRYPLFTVMIESKRGTFVITKEQGLIVYDRKIKDLLGDFEKKLPRNSILEDLEDFNDDSYWEEYYSSQFIKARKNRKYFQKNIPKKFHNLDSLKTEKKHFENNITLTDF